MGSRTRSHLEGSASDKRRGSLEGPGLDRLSLAPVGLVSLTPTLEGLPGPDGKAGVQGGEGVPSPLSWALSFTPHHFSSSPNTGKW